MLHGTGEDWSHMGHPCSWLFFCSVTYKHWTFTSNLPGLTKRRRCRDAAARPPTLGPGMPVHQLSQEGGMMRGRRPHSVTYLVVTLWSSLQGSLHSNFPSSRFSLKPASCKWYIAGRLGSDGFPGTVEQGFLHHKTGSEGKGHLRQEGAGCVDLLFGFAPLRPPFIRRGVVILILWLITLVLFFHHNYPHDPVLITTVQDLFLPCSAHSKLAAAVVTSIITMISFSQHVSAQDSSTVREVKRSDR